MGCASSAPREERKLSGASTASTSAPLAPAVLDLLGPTLQTRQGEQPTEHVLGGKTIGLYFSAHWCPPCRGFTPQLAKAYTKDLKKKGLEIVFVSSDKDDQEFQSYFASMPWSALPFADRARKTALSTQFKVEGIPTLVLLDAEGQLITADARASVSQDPRGTNFPWKPKTLHELLDTPLEGPRGRVDMKDLDGKVIGIYFSAHWCPPCRGFTPQLAEQYKKIKAAGLPFEIVFASSDQNEKAFREYFQEMPWLALPFADRARKEALSSHFGVRGIPTLVLLDVDRSVLTTSGRAAVFRDLAEVPWAPRPVRDLEEDAGALSDHRALVVLCDGCTPEAQERCRAQLEPLAVELNAQAKAAKADPECLVFLATQSAGPAQQIRQLCRLDASAEPQVVVFDIPDRGFYLPETEVTTEGLRAMLGDVKAGRLAKKQLGGS
jgi:nucleoredoxin